MILTSKEKPRVSMNPGSDLAIAKGCRCPRMDNAYGMGYRGSEIGSPVFVVEDQCPLHGRAVEREVEG